MTHKVSYRVDVLRRGAKFSELRWLKDSAPDVLVDATGSIMGSLGGTFMHNPDIEYLSDELQPVLELDGREYPLGVYRITTYSDTVSAQGHFLRLDAYDRSWMIQTIKTEGILHLAAGTNYLTAVQQLMTQAGIGLVIATPTAETLQTDREDWQEGTDYLTICNQLLGEINYKPVWFDGSGIGHLEPKATPNAANIRWRYSSTDIRLLAPVSRDMSQEQDIFDAPNVFIAICSNPDLEAPLVARAENNSPSSSISIFKRGQRITQVVKVDNIASQEALQAYVDDLCFQSQLGTRTITFYGLPEGGHGVGDVLSIDAPEFGGIYEETGWQLRLSPGELMTHTAKRTVIA